MKIPTIPVRPMPKNKRMRSLIEQLIELEGADYDRLSSSGKEALEKIWNLLGMPSQEQLYAQRSEEEE
tara:strand:+ start:4852 stop:5055 length:204 start_codon:yes stop_codon:yes gene_type:complete